MSLSADAGSAVPTCRIGCCDMAGLKLEMVSRAAMLTHFVEPRLTASGCGRADRLGRSHTNALRLGPWTSHQKRGSAGTPLRWQVAQDHTCASDPAKVGAQLVSLLSAVSAHTDLKEIPRASAEQPHSEDGRI